MKPKKRAGVTALSIAPPAFESPSLACPRSKHGGTVRPESGHSVRRPWRWFVAALMAVTMGGWVAPACAQRVLVYDENTKYQVAQTACANLGYACTRAVADDFVALLEGASWDLVVMDLPGDEPRGDWQQSLADHVTAGGAAIHSHWRRGSLAGLPTVFDVAIGPAHQTLSFWQWDAHPLFTTPNTVPPLFDEWLDRWGANGFRLSVAPSTEGEAAAGFTETATSGEAAIVVGNEGRTLWNGFLFDDFAGTDEDADEKFDIVELIENEMRLVLGTDDRLAACPSSPDPTCLPTNEGGLLVREEHPGRERLVAKLQKGAAFSQIDLGDPTAAEGTAFHFCIYDDEDALVTDIEVDRAGHACGKAPCWRPIGRAAPDGRGYRYRDGEGAAGGVTRMRLKSHEHGRSSIKIAAKNDLGRGRAGLPSGITADLAGTAHATLQLHGTDAAICLSARLENVRIASPQRFQAS